MDLRKLPKTEFAAAVAQIAGERNIDAQSILDSIELGLVSAYKKDQKDKGNPIDDTIDFSVNLSPQTGIFRIFRIEENGNKVDVTPPGFGRIAAQTAKQVIDQKITEAERENIIAEYRDKIGTLIYGNILRIESSKIIIGINKTEGILPKAEQVRNQEYELGSRKLFLMKDIVEDELTGKKNIILSQADREFVHQLFVREVPEVSSGTVILEKIARSPGERTKVAVFSKQAGIDPVGSCIGQKGTRIQSVLNELPGHEKIDVILFSTNLDQFIVQALSPAQEVRIVSQDDNKVTVSVPEDQLALAIGAGGENVRLAGYLIDRDIDIISHQAKTKSTSTSSIKTPKKSGKTKRVKKNKETKTKK
ncbi:transcription termination factor NusA [Patescibacteria group bacterium]|nr:transcription termination factor NusA [Patescibacteria group bacterium]MCG2701568.1 transcription termination factor NusA [Candidatus Parcubacteria bacterium]MBU4210274.1 transcription termination factor NusA [Patescibacteria group bacterium]MBU4264464.1 transcription termination factor NusA [Patescibacteria group bacterium]MBU4390395.1 transcription termination factor NusA [Patescibacteria group bacterium]